MKKISTLPMPVRRALLKLGKDIRSARIRRRISTSLMASRALITRMTLYKTEKGDPTVSVATYATVLFILGMIDRLADVADARFDEVGISLEEEQLPKRIRSRSPLPKAKPTTEIKP